MYYVVLIKHIFQVPTNRFSYDLEYISAYLEYIQIPAKFYSFNLEYITLNIWNISRYLPNNDLESIFGKFRIYMRNIPRYQAIV